MNELKENIYDKVISKILVVMSIIYLVIIVINTFITSDPFDVIFDIFPLFVIGVILAISIKNFSQSFMIKYPTSYKIAIWRYISIAIPVFVFSYTILGFFSFFVLFIAYIIVLTTISSNNKKDIINLQNNISTPETVTNPQTENKIPDIKIATMAGMPKKVVQTQTNIDYTDYVKSEEFGELYEKTEEEMVNEFIKMELEKANYTINKKLIPSPAKKRKYILRIILAVLVFIYVSLIFFHFPKTTYIVGAIILFIDFYLSKSYDFMDYLKKKIKERPDEKISNIIMSETQNLVEDRSFILTISTVLVAIIASLAIFINPVIIYEKVENGYAVRYYAYGLTNDKTATIPETHNGKPVVSLRGNAFSNMKNLEEVTLPDTITEIRGQAFKNDSKLKKVKLPSKLEYLGGSAFDNCTSLEEIELPDTLTYLGGKAFYNNKSLKTVNIPSSLTEINGSTFAKCTSLEEIIIPDGITKIGGAAFSEATSLKKVVLSKNITEIGGEAFYHNRSLKEIELPDGLQEIRGNTFENCSSLERIDIPDSVIRIGGHAFYGCSSLKEVYISPRSNLNEIGSSAFRLCSSLKTITIPSSTIVNERAFKESPTKVYKYTIKSVPITDYDM